LLGKQSQPIDVCRWYPKYNYDTS